MRTRALPVVILGTSTDPPDVMRFRFAAIRWAQALAILERWRKPGPPPAPIRRAFIRALDDRLPTLEDFAFTRARPHVHVRHDDGTRRRARRTR
jgi:hypothetical protein